MSIRGGHALVGIRSAQDQADDTALRAEAQLADAARGVGGDGRWRRRLVSVAVAAALVALWAIVAALRVFGRAELPTPLRVVHDFVHAAVQGYGGHSLLAQAQISVERVVVGFIAAVLLGVVVGMFMAIIPVVHDAIDPMLQFLRPIPPLAFIPLLVTWFGIGELPKVLLIFFCTLPIVILNTLSGVRGTQESRLRVAQCLGASRVQTLRHVILPSALPEVFTGMRVGLGVAWTCLVAAEMVAASRGLGWMVLQAGHYLQSGMIFVAIISIGVVGFLMDFALRLIEQRVVPWKGKA